MTEDLQTSTITAELSTSANLVTVIKATKQM